ncbi:MAG TPA: diacylglycerol kinase family protein [Actinomycetota bacterium]|nr:diacylglycerol kinase family protein [Actinomycetota bacterium]
MSSPFGVLTVIADPRRAPAMPAVERALDARGLEHRTVVANGIPAARLATQALEEGHRFLVAVGDDATVQDVVNGMFREGRPILEEPVLGVIPAGEGCELAKSFGLPSEPVAAVAHLTGGTTYALDLMKVTATLDGVRVARYAHNLAQIGMGARQATITARAPTWLGGTRRFYGFWRGYLATKPTVVSIAHDTRTWEGLAWNVVVANAQFTDGGLRLSPRSFPGDGVLDALVFTGPRSGAYTQLPRLFRHGDHLPDPSIAELKAKIRFEVTAADALPVVADGVPLGTTPVTFQVVARQVLFKL